MAMILNHPEELDALLQGRPETLLLDVRLREDYEAGHLPGAVNQCVFEVAFLQELAGRGTLRQGPVCVYGAASDSLESQVAATKLEQAGYTEVYDLRTGVAGWLEAGRRLETRSLVPEVPVPGDGVHPLDLAESRVVWVGRNLINHHWGHVALSEGEVTFQKGRPVSGRVTLDLRRITCADLAGGPLHDVLIHHLESDDFFDVANHPSAEFTFDHAEVCADAPGCHNLNLHGQLTLRGVTHPLTLACSAGFLPDGRAALQGTVVLDRTRWGVNYGSGRLFRRLGGHLVNDHIELQLRVLTAGPMG